MDENIATAKRIIEKILYMTIATVDKNGQTWNSPVYSAYDENYNFYWASDLNGQHSKNIAGNGKFLLLFMTPLPLREPAEEYTFKPKRVCLQMKTKY